MKTALRSLCVASAVLVQVSETTAGVLYDHDVDRGNLTLTSQDGPWNTWETDYPIVGGWMSPSGPVSTGNGPNGSLWCFTVQGGREWGANGVWDTPITLDQVYNHTGLDTRNGWGIWWVYGENVVLGYNMANQPAPPDLPRTFLLSYSAGVIPEPSSARLFLASLLALGMFGMICSRRRANPAHALDGGIPSLFHTGSRWPTASDVRRSATL